MATTMASSAKLLCALILLLPTSMVTAKRTYIVAMNHLDKPDSFPTHHDWHTAIVESLSTSSTTSESLLYSYKIAFNGFSAVLDEAEAESLRKSKSVLGVYEDTVYSLHTTRTPHFLGLDSNAGIWEGHSNLDLDHAMENVIIGVLDTGIWPESKSFDDTGLPAIPKKWRGKCVSGKDFNPNMCNKKLIGARYYSKGYDSAVGADSAKEIKSPRDHEGHGTHTASTAAGSKVPNVSLLGYANGTARGMAFNSRVAAYKVCWVQGCFGSDILAAMEQAIVDGVDVLSLSLGGESTAYSQDPIALGGFSAMEKGIFVSCSAGNSGPTTASLANGAPWITTVGAGSLDRNFPAKAFLGNQVGYEGVSLYSGKGMGSKRVPLVYDNKTTESSSLCLPGSLNKALVKGKVVLCDRGQNARVEKGLVVREAGGVGMILANTVAAGGEELLADSHLLPAVAVGAKVGDLIRKYAAFDPKPTALLTFGGTVLNVHPSPVVAAFSSRGPNWVTPQILKPDIVGPGVNILAAWPDLGPTGLVNDTRKSKFTIISGTSMSCPHISGLAALVKAAHPDWSPSAIRSALMTTAYNQDNTNSPIKDAADGSVATPWASGAGYVDPRKALSPGLVYDTTPRQYISFICSLGYSQEEFQLIVKNSKLNCSRKTYSDPGQLNYPSFSPVFSTKRVIRYTRTLTNVGPASSSYSVNIKVHPLVDTTVSPKKLVFTKVGQKVKYTVTFVAKNLIGPTDHPYAFGSIVWASAQHQVRSPIAFTWARAN